MIYKNAFESGKHLWGLYYIKTQLFLEIHKNIWKGNIIFCADGVNLSLLSTSYLQFTIVV